MADPVKQQGGGEQLPAPPSPPAPAPVSDAPPAIAQETATPAEQPPAVEQEKTEVQPNIVQEQKNDEPKTEVAQVIPEQSEEPQAVTPNVQAEVISPPQENSIPPAEQSIAPDAEKIAGPVQAAPETNASNNIANGSDIPDWQERETELLKKIEELEKVKNARSEDGLRLELKVREEEIDLLKARVKNLEMELQAALSKPGGKNHEMIENIKHQHEELLSKARGMIFDKTKMVKNQELQIEALTTQVQSLKDINVITKDLLEIRNSEVKAMEERFQAMEARYKAEKERYDLVLKRAQTSTNINDDLRKEYETQLAIFKELREKYELRVQALVAENNRLKESAKGPGTSG